MGIRLSTISRYGLRAMIELAKNESGGLLSAKEISLRQNIPLRYLENIMLRLLASGLVISSRGKKGGFSLSREPSKIKISEIIKALEGGSFITPCVDDPSICKRSPFCETRPLWKEMNEILWEALESKTLEDLLKR